MTFIARCFVLLIVFAFHLPAASAEKRIALVIGNSAYKNAPRLVNPKNDAEDIAAALKRVGFETIVGLDLDKNGMENAAVRFARAARDADTALFYYSGHAMQFAGNNYLMPVDAKLIDEADLRFLVRTDSIVADLQQAKSLRILVLDSCRDNPLAEELKRSIGGTRSAGITRGLAKIDSPQGMIVAYATQSGRTADDGKGRNSPYTTAFLKHIEQPAEIGTVFRRISADVFSATQNTQLPELSLSLIGEFYLRAPPPPVDNAKAEAARQSELAALQDKLRAMQEQLDKKESASKQATTSPSSVNKPSSGPVRHLHDVSIHIGENSLGGVAFLNDRTVISMGKDKLINRWNIDTREVERAWVGDGSEVTRIEISADRDWMFVNERNRVSAYRGLRTPNAAPQLVWKNSASSDCDNVFAITSELPLLARSGTKGTLSLYDATTGKFKHSINDTAKECNEVQFASKGRLLSTTLNLWDASTRKLTRNLGSLDPTIKSAPNVALAEPLYAVLSDGNLSVRDFDTGALSWLVRTSCFKAQMAFSDLVRFLILGCEDKLTIYDSRTGALLQNLTAKEPIRAIKVSPDGERFITLYGDGVGVWELDEFGKSSGR